MCLLCQLFFEEFSCQAFLAGRYLFRCSTCYHFATAIASVRSHIDDMVGTFDDFHVVLNDEDGVASCYQGVEGFHQFRYIMEMQPRCRALASLVR